MLGIVFFCVGFFCLLNPVAELISFLPMFDSLLKTAFWIVSIIAGLTLSLATIACAWVYARPLAASVAFAAVGAIVLASQGGFTSTGAEVAVGILFCISVIELLAGIWMAVSDYLHRAEMQRQIAEIKAEAKKDSSV